MPYCVALYALLQLGGAYFSCQITPTNSGTPPTKPNCNEGLSVCHRLFVSTVCCDLPWKPLTGDAVTWHISTCDRENDSLRHSLLVCMET